MGDPAPARAYATAGSLAELASRLGVDGCDVADDEELDAVSGGGFSEDFFLAFREAGRRHWNR